MISFAFRTTLHTLALPVSSSFTAVFRMVLLFFRGRISVPTLPQFAPFVNLARQVLLENELCLLGFSGDDPNFIEWSGWVRDQLGGHARPIRLVGALDLSYSRLRLLEKRNVTPIDLAPLVKDVPGENRHLRAAEIFLGFLHKARPQPKDASDPEGQLKLIAGNPEERGGRTPGDKRPGKSGD